MNKKMKKRNEWVRKLHKRRAKKKDRGIVDFAMIQNHFFKELPEWINQMEDPRNQSYTIYTQADFVYMGILKNIFSLESMRQMEENLMRKHVLNPVAAFRGPGYDGNAAL